MIMEDFVPFELAKKLKKKGFDCKYPFAIYNELGSYCPLTTSSDCVTCESSYNDYDENDIIAPTISQVLKWLRKEKKLHIVIIIWGRTWGYNIIELPSGRSLHWTAYQEDIKSYEDAAIAGIEYVLDNLI